MNNGRKPFPWGQCQQFKRGVNYGVGANPCVRPRVRMSTVYESFLRRSRNICFPVNRRKISYAKDIPKPGAHAGAPLHCKGNLYQILKLLTLPPREGFFCLYRNTCYRWGISRLNRFAVLPYRAPLEMTGFFSSKLKAQSIFEPKAQSPKQF